jgi:hypothetical protein
LREFIEGLTEDDHETVEDIIARRWRSYDRLDAREHNAHWDRRPKMSSAEFLRSLDPGELVDLASDPWRLCGDAAVEAFIESGATAEAARAEAAQMFSWQNLLADLLFGEQVDEVRDQQDEARRAGVQAALQRHVGDPRAREVAG